ncbi:bromodomain-containing protein DDB_G0270170 isoform X2 [Octopus bimaculoides]|uniref:bromodomain-containing protein DDB_G0270170 isoform X2 n=1 Tax=Octopus bimaculoides TaxID=37653 RepID=UPI00071E5E8F|nr:bromodomain-containing protein DDB_G0270170 isoform X2 [Octopus bimaculoides]|eukprot:XP_014788087.1 PREDICTED: bromodomain-containing protein DDB_G0270170-like isoform X2 [Octopus bimaculoides]
MSSKSQFHSGSELTLLNKAVHDISDSDATEEPESLPDSEPDSDVTVDRDNLAYNSGQDLFSDYSNNSFDRADTEVAPCLSTEHLKIMSSKKSRQETHAISESDSDSESEQNSRTKYNSKHHVQKLSSSVKVDSRKHHNPCRENGSRSSSHESRQKTNKTNHHTLQHSSSSSSKDSSNSSKKSSHKPDSSAVNGSELFSNPVNLGYRSSSLTSQSNNSLTSKKTSHCSPTPPPKKTSHTEKATNQNNTSSSLNSKLHDIFGSDSDEDFVVNNNSSDSENDSSSNSDVNGNSPDTNYHSPMTHSSSSHHKMSPSSSHSSSSSPASSSSDDDDNSGIDKHSPKSKIKSVKSDSSDISPKSSKTNSLGKSSVTSTTKTALDKLVSSSEDSETVKRKRPATPTKPICKFGTACTRKNPTHWEDFEHHEIEEKKPVKKQKADNDSAATASVSKSPVAPPTPEKKSQSGDKTMSLEKSIRTTYREGQPFSFFLTRVKGISSQYNSSFVMGISDILSSAFGNLQASCQFNYMFDIKWLMQQYAPEFRQKPVLIVHGFKGSEMTGLQNDASKFSSVSLCQMEKPCISSSA